MGRLSKTDRKDLLGAISNLDRKLDNLDRHLSQDRGEIKSAISNLQSEIDAIPEGIEGIRSDINKLSSELKVTQSEIKDLSIGLERLESRLWLFIVAVLSLTIITLLGICAWWLFPNTVKF